jgi:mRNA-degrading endonuclease YafQ of YafQ-DinJ toxin-antitoxin module
LSSSKLEFRTTKLYDKSFAALPVNIQRRALEKLALYENNPRHPSLRVKKLEATRDVWEISVTRSYRITFQRAGQVVLLRNIGTHDILKRE